MMTDDDDDDCRRQKGTDTREISSLMQNKQTELIVRTNELVAVCNNI
jgi:hypothetical protein